VALAPYRWEVDLATVTEGRREMRVEAQDQAGNRSERRRTYEVDNTPPTVLIDNPAAGRHPYQPVEVLVTPHDDTGVMAVEFVVNGALLGSDEDVPYGAFVDFRDYAHGTRLHIEVTAIDLAGNRTRPPAVVDVTLD
jgi:hypothetical protein